MTVFLWSIHTVSHFDFGPGWLWTTSSFPVPSARKGNVHDYILCQNAWGSEILNPYSYRVIHKKFRRESKSISAVFVILKLLLQKSNGQVQVQLAMPDSNRRRRNLTWLQVITRPGRGPSLGFETGFFSLFFLSRSCYNLRSAIKLVVNSPTCLCIMVSVVLLRMR